MFFHALTFAGGRRKLFEHELLGRVFKHRHRDPASVDAMKQTCVIVILAYLPDFSFNRAENIKYPFSNTRFLKTKRRQRQIF